MTLPQAALARIAEQAEQYLSTRDEATLVVGMTVRGERFVQCFRSATAEVVEVPNSATIYEIGSVSKIFTTTLLAVLEAQGVLSVDDPISTHLPELKLAPQIGAITLRQLATHSSGLSSTGQIHLGFIAEEIRGTQPPFGAYTHYLRYRKEHLYSDLETAELVYPTGEGWQYSILGMGTLGHILELVTARPYEDLLRSVIVEPLQLRSTGYALTAEQRARVMYAYDAEGQPLPNWYHDVLLPQGGLRSSMDDLLTFAEAYLQASSGGTSALSIAMRRTREEHLALPPGPDTPDPTPLPWTDQIRQGLAWRHIDHPKGNASWHPGTTLFYHSGFGVDEHAQTGCVLLSSDRKTLGQMDELNALFLSWFEQIS